MNKFDRWNSCYPRSFAHSRFMKHQTEINELYWSLPPVAGYTEYLARNAPLGTRPDKLFRASGSNVHRIAQSLNQWQNNFSSFQNWVRLSSLMSALSYFESYVSTASTLALRSDPLLRFGQSRFVDGIVWLKRDVKDDTSARIKPLVKGDWSARISAYRELFGCVPPLIQNELSNLDCIRRFRNGVAHTFGRDPTFFENPMVDAGKSVSLSERRMQKWLSIIGSCADAIDSHLFCNHIGEFELIWRYHLWKANARDPIDMSYNENAAFSRFVRRTFGSGPGRVFCRELIAFYDAA